MTEEKVLSLDQALSHGWEMMKKNFWFLLVVFVITVAVSMVFSFFSDPLSKHLHQTIPAVLYAVLMIMDCVVGLIITIGMRKIYLKIIDGIKPEFNDLYLHYKYFWRYLAVSLLYGLLVIAGLILLIFPGIYWAIKYRFAPILVIDQNTSVMESFHKSAEMTKGVMWSLFAFDWITLIIVMIGFLVIFVGIIPAAFVVSLANIFIYRKLAGKSKAKEPVKELTEATATA